MINCEIEDLIANFEKVMTYNGQDQIEKLKNSRAQKEIVQRGQKALKPIIEHLTKSMPEPYTGLDLAWTRLLNRIEILIDVDRTAPENLQDVKGWIEWAKKFA